MMLNENITVFKDFYIITGLFNYDYREKGLGRGRLVVGQGQGLLLEAFHLIFNPEYLLI